MAWQDSLGDTLSSMTSLLRSLVPHLPLLALCYAVLKAVEMFASGACGDARPRILADASRVSGRLPALRTQTHLCSRRSTRTPSRASCTRRDARPCMRRHGRRAS